MARRWLLLPAGMVAALGLRVLYVFVRYILGATGTQRFHVESAALIFVACGFVLRLTRSRRGEGEPARSVSFPLWMWIACCGLAIALYWPALSIGFLSDDFVLVSRASSWNIGPVTPALFRPVPLLLWSLLLHAGAGATTLHVLNVVLHGTNAYWTTRIVEQWLHDRIWSLLAGLLVLTAPLAPEAVVWCSGVFDVVATAFVLASILIARRYEHRATVGTRIQFLAVGMAAVMSKETAAIGAGLVLLDAWVRSAISRKLLVDTAILITAIGVFSLVRLAAAFGFASPPLSKYVLQHGIFGSFGGLAVPWHVEVVQRVPWLPALGVLLVVYLLIVFFNESGSRHRVRLAIAATAWILLSIVPIWPVFFVAPDLQASRYLYLPEVGWGALVVVVAASEQTGRYLKVFSIAAVIGLVAIGAYGTRLHLGPWTDAARLRDRVETTARFDARMKTCRTVTLSKMPDSVRGAYVFRNGVPEAFARDLHLNVTLAASGGPCSFQWSDARGSFVQPGTE